MIGSSGNTTCEVKSGKTLTVGTAGAFPPFTLVEEGTGTSESAT